MLRPCVPAIGNEEVGSTTRGRTMITSISLVDFKNFENELLSVGPLSVIVGANASGKSNIRDAFRFLHAIGRGYTLAEIIGGKYGAGGQTEWEPIRGAPNELGRLRQTDGYYGFLVSVDVKNDQQTISYSIGVRSDADDFGGFRLAQESLSEGGTSIYTSHPDASDPVQAQDDAAHLLLRMGKVGDQRKYGDRVAVRPNQPALTQIGEHGRVRRAHKEIVEYVIDVLGNMRFLDLVPDRMRHPAFPGQTVLGDGGENLPTVLRTLCADSRRKDDFLAWTRELTPMDVKDFYFHADPVTGLVQLAMVEAGGNKVSAYSMSDGTLRFLAMLAALLSDNPAMLYFFEEIDNGIHPSRLRLLIELLETRTEKGPMQVVTTSHSPDLLSMVNERTFRNMSVVCRLEDASNSIIRPVSEIPSAADLRKTQGLGRLHASGWLEDALAFTEDGEEEYPD